MRALALPLEEIPLEWHPLPTLAPRWANRGGTREARFHLRHPAPVLPVWYRGELQLLRWGNRDRRNGLPAAAWAWQATYAAGGWKPFGAEEADVPARYGLDGAVWVAVREGVRALVVRDGQGLPVVYLLCQPATHYYRVMTRAERMPVFIGEVI
jgi:hypothetical protein